MPDGTKPLAGIEPSFKTLFVNCLRLIAKENAWRTFKFLNAETLFSLSSNLLIAEDKRAW